MAKSKKRRATFKAAQASPRPTRFGLPVVACFGERCLEAELISESSEPNQGERVDLLLSAEALHHNPPDLTATLKVHHDPSLGVPPDHRTRFGGYVTNMELREDGLWLVKAHNMADWGDHVTGGLGIRNFQAPEVLWAIARDLGLSPERIQIAGWNPPLEPMLVAIPVDGTTPIGELEAGRIGLTQDPEVPKRFAGLGPQELQDAFKEPGFWAIGTFQAPTLWDGEQAAVRTFERVVRRLVLAARYSLAATPDGTLRTFLRARQLEDVRLRPIAGVEGLRSGRIWLRGYGRAIAAQPLDSGVLEGVEAYIGVSAVRIDDAIASWRRATTERDPSVAIVALAEALEFYAATVVVPRLFTDDELAAIRTKASEGLSGDRAARVERMVGQLNEPPLNARLRTAIETDGAPCSREEFQLLVKLRGLRSKIVHGQARKTLGDDELRLALGLVNRLLLFRLHRIRSGSEKTRS